MTTVIGIILLIAALFLVISVLLQSSKSHKLPGTIAGGAETFFGKSKGSAIDRMLEKLTTVVAIVFCVLVIVLYVIQPGTPIVTENGTTTDLGDTSGMTNTVDTDTADTGAVDTDVVDTNVVDTDAVDTAADTSDAE